MHEIFYDSTSIVITGASQTRIIQPENLDGEVMWEAHLDRNYLANTGKRRTTYVITWTEIEDA